jgi:hypothetical protein
LFESWLDILSTTVILLGAFIGGGLGDKESIQP